MSLVLLDFLSDFVCLCIYLPGVSEWRERRCDSSDSQPVLTYVRNTLLDLNKVGLAERATPGLLAIIPGELIRSASRWRKKPGRLLAAREGELRWRRRKQGRRGGIRRRNGNENPDQLYLL